MSNLTISNQTPVLPGMNFLQLRQQGINYIENLASNVWTDYNSHDPGITILEQLCYAITDLSYRLNFAIADLLAEPLSSQITNDFQFFTARQILATNPVTISDYRKLIIDIDGVKNAWLEINPTRSVAIYYNPSQYRLSFDSTNNTPIHLNGLYRVVVATANANNDEQAFRQLIAHKLSGFRNLCEDFYSIEILPPENISLLANVDIDEKADAEALLANIYFQLQNFISPSIRFYTLAERLAAGLMPEDIFSGPALAHGFIDDTELANFDKSKEIHLSDIIGIISNVTGISDIKEISLLSNISKLQPNPWILTLDPNNSPTFTSLLDFINNFHLYKKQTAIQIDADKVANYLNALIAENQVVNNQAATDLPIPFGEYRDLADYESIQNDFPITYGIGKAIIPASASEKRKAQAKQLKAYLTLFDQLLANYFAQLAHAKDFLAINNSIAKNNTTYFSQPLTTINNLDEVLTIHGDTTTLNKLVEPLDQSGVNSTALDRRNRSLDHLLARHGEQYNDDSLLLYSLVARKEELYRIDHPEYDTHFFDVNETPAQRLLKVKQDFLSNYASISYQRNTAFNYLDNPVAWNTNNVSGLYQRICKLLGITNTQRRLLSFGNDEGFHIIEHILLRPRDEDKLVPYPRPITAFAKSLVNPLNNINCASFHHGLKVGDKITITVDSGAIDVMIKVVTLNNFEADLTNGVTGVDPDIIKLKLNNLLFAGTGSWDYTDPANKFPRAINNYSASNTCVICTTAQPHNLRTNDKIQITNADVYDDVYQVNVIDEKNFTINIKVPYKPNVTTGSCYSLDDSLVVYSISSFVQSTVCATAIPHGLQNGDKVHIIYQNGTKELHEINGITCELLLTESAPSINLSSVKNAAYVRYGNQLFYINKNLVEFITVIDISDSTMLANFDLEMKTALLEVDQPKRLSDIELLKISSILGQTHLKEFAINKAYTTGVTAVSWLYYIGDYFSFTHAITAIEAADDSFNPKRKIKSLNHRLQAGDRIYIDGGNDPDTDSAIYSVAEVIDADTFIVKAEFAIPTQPTFWLYESIYLQSLLTTTSQQPVDPYSFQLTFIFPNWLIRFKDASFRNFVRELIARETPAHITINIEWWDRKQMNAFEKIYNSWLLHRTMQSEATSTEIEDVNYKLITALNWGNKLVPTSEEVFGYIGDMVVSQDFHISYPEIPNVITEEDIPYGIATLTVTTDPNTGEEIRTVSDGMVINQDFIIPIATPPDILAY